MTLYVSPPASSTPLAPLDQRKRYCKAATMGKKKNKQQEAEPGACRVEAAAPTEGGEEEEDKGGRGEKELMKVSEAAKEEKNDDRSITVVLKVDMHCEGCAKKVIRSVKGMKGVEAVKVDVGDGKITVIGKLDPWKLRDRVETKTHKKVDIVSPTNFPKKSTESNSTNRPSAATVIKANAGKQPDDKKPQEKLHCEGCMRRIRKMILKCKGVESVVFDGPNDMVTVKGTMDAKPLPDALKKRLKREVEVVQPKKVGGGSGSDKKEKKEKEEGDEGGEKKKKGKGGEKDTRKAVAAESADPENSVDHYAGYGYRIEMMHTPILFSDENPNSCSVM